MKKFFQRIIISASEERNENRNSHFVRAKTKHRFNTSQPCCEKARAKRVPEIPRGLPRGTFIFLASLIVASPTVVFAASIYFHSNTQEISRGDTFIVETKISSSQEEINVVDGTILFDKEKLSVKELSTGGSILGVWASEPAFSNQAGTISFVGGTPGGFSGEKGLLLKIVFYADKVGETKFSLYDGFSVFLNDGNGTRIIPQYEPYTLHIVERPNDILPRDEWQDIVTQDTNEPEYFDISIGRDQSLFNGRYFASFFSTDKESGIAYYEIKEGDTDFIKTESPHLLKDQSLQSEIIVRAVDKAGNEKVVSYKKEIVSPLQSISKINKSYLLTIVLVLFGFVVWVVWWFFSKNK